jgi:hypothetical protein
VGARPGLRHDDVTLDDRVCRLRDNNVCRAGIEVGAREGERQHASAKLVIANVGSNTLLPPVVDKTPAFSTSALTLAARGAGREDVIGYAHAGARRPGDGGVNAHPDAPVGVHRLLNAIIA